MVVALRNLCDMLKGQDFTRPDRLSILYPLENLTVRKLAFTLCLGLAALTCLSFSLAQEGAGQAATEAAQAGQKKNQAGGKNQATPPVAAAKAFLATLSPEQKAKAQLDYKAESRLGWHFIPMESRKGLPLMEMNDEQKVAAKAVLRAAVSALGYGKATTIMQLESLLLQLEGPKSEGRRNPEKYYFTLFGTPAVKETWGLSVEGHHLSLNFSLLGNKIVDSTPQFMGANPAVLKDNYGEQFKKGMRVLRDEEQLAFELVKSLDEKQQAAAMLPGEVPQDIRAAGEAQPPTDAPRGIAAADLTSEQQAQLRKLIEVYSAKMKPGVVQQRWQLIDEAGFDKIHFAWSGATKPGIGHYYAIQGPTFVIEFINVQADAAGNPANHIHCVWRDMQGDFNLPIAGK